MIRYRHLTLEGKRERERNVLFNDALGREATILLVLPNAASV